MGYILLIVKGVHLTIVDQISRIWINMSLTLFSIFAVPYRATINSRSGRDYATIITQ